MINKIIVSPGQQMVGMIRGGRPKTVFVEFTYENLSKVFESEVNELNFRKWLLTVLNSLDKTKAL